MKVVKRIKHYPGEHIEENEKIAYDKLVLGMSNKDLVKKYDKSLGRLYAIWQKYKVVKDSE